ncbi:hypothetical protein KY334_03055 [Candidatus Woesearchaeota archaeon]|nr:hypothetical protein [Candidatus Woesearchaeota archaeon]
MMDDDYYSGEHEENLYSEEDREEYIDGGEISAEEDAFMKGYEDAEEDDEDLEDDYEQDSEEEESED